MESAQVRFILIGIAIVVASVAMCILCFCAVRCFIKLHSARNASGELAAGRARRVKPQPQKPKQKIRVKRKPKKRGLKDEQARPIVGKGPPEGLPRKSDYRENYVYEGVPDSNHFSAPVDGYGPYQPYFQPPFGQGDILPMQFIHHEAKRYSKNVERYKK